MSILDTSKSRSTGGLKLATSKSDAKRLVEAGSVSIDGNKVTDPRAIIAVRPGLIVRGRRRHYARIALPTNAGA